MARLYVKLVDDLIMCKSLLHVTEFEGMKESWRVAQAWNCMSKKTTVEVIGKSAASVAMEILGYWRCHYHGTTGKYSNRCGVSLPEELFVLRMAELEK